MTNKKGDKEEDKRRQGQRKRADTRSDRPGRPMNRNVGWPTVKGGHHP